MGKRYRKPAATPDIERVSLGELIHEHVRVAIETAIHEELYVALGVRSYERHEARRGYRNGRKTRTLTGPSGPLTLRVPRATLFGGRERTSALLALDLCAGESFAAWKGCLDDLAARGLRAPVLCIIDGNAGLRRAVSLVWPRAAVQRCCVHKLRNLERKARSTLSPRSATTFIG